MSLLPSIRQDYLSPSCSSATLDLFIVRKAILTALSAQLPLFKGTLLDVGCGYQPYKSLVLAYPSRAEKYIGLDVANDKYQEPDIKWNGKLIPLHSASVECALATEVFEHCPDPDAVMGEVLRVLKPGGMLFLTVPFLWPLHDVPHDEYRYTPFALQRHLEKAGFTQVQLKALGGWDASLAQMIALWLRRRPMSAPVRAVFSRFAVPVVRYLFDHDLRPVGFCESSMITGLSGTAVKPAR